MMVPTVTETCLAHLAHSNVQTLVAKAQGPIVAAGGTAEPLRPADAEQVLGTGAVIGETAPNRDQGTRIAGRDEGPPRQIS